MLEKLIEYWLDSVGERGYQAAFVQMLFGEGHTVFHSTRHVPIEFGKDVISVDGDGVPCAFQLKGNPGTRLTLNQFREMRPQLEELVRNPIVYPGYPETPHKSYLVTNGEVEEEVQRNIDDMNRGYEKSGLHTNQRLHIISRGRLLRWSMKHAGEFWPSDFSAHQRLIQFYNIDGRDTPDMELLSGSVDSILNISEKRHQNTATEFRRRLVSAAIFIALASRNYVQCQNHNAIAASYVVLTAQMISASVRYERALDFGDGSPFSLARSEIFNATNDLLAEVDSIMQRIDSIAEENGDQPNYDKAFIQGGMLADHLMWQPRALKTSALAALLVLENTRTDQVIYPPKTEQTIQRLIKRRLKIWGEAAVPQALCLIWAKRNYDATLKIGFHYFQLLNAIVEANLSTKKGYLPTPYHNLEDCIRHRLVSQFGIGNSKVEEESHNHSSFFTEGLLHCFVRYNLKTYAKGIWPKLTHLVHRSFVPEKTWQYCLWRVEHGTNESKHFVHKKEWSDLQIEAAGIEMPNLPEQFRNDPVLLLAFIIYFPHRALPEVVRYLHGVFDGTRFLPVSQPGD